ncbi:hypothetical protein [Clostridium scatologenes]|uniref:Uncharacterized protein n=1 Tax=Clostridium scatologenes TaxID=1548 RepID=A0A0E3K280_CLOSL|nr:hypothetical protein [Clostridium scatologenes]AKA70549.1 hypothetical protein CSCA_3424 [Clostridium scatologenes]
MSILFKDDQFDFQVLRLLGETVYCAADLCMFFIVYKLSPKW